MEGVSDGKRGGDDGVDGAEAVKEQQLILARAVRYLHFTVLLVSLYTLATTGITSKLTGRAQVSPDNISHSFRFQHRIV